MPHLKERGKEYKKQPPLCIINVTLVCKIVKLISTSCTFCSINTRLTAAHTSVPITLQAGGVSRIAVTGRAACPTIKVIIVYFTLLTMLAYYILPAGTLPCFRMARCFICTSHATVAICEINQRRRADEQKH